MFIREVNEQKAPSDLPASSLLLLMAQATQKVFIYPTKAFLKAANTFQKAACLFQYTQHSMQSNKTGTDMGYQGGATCPSRTHPTPVVCFIKFSSPPL